MSVDNELGARLAAYLDGEADAAERQSIEELLAAHPEARRALDGMRAAKALLHEYDTQAATPTTQTEALLPDLSGEHIDHFVLDARIGRGGMGEVYRALDTSLNRPVAVKLVSPNVARAPVLADRFVREARLQAQIDHPHVAHVYFVGQYGERRYFAMEYLPGGSLEDRLWQGQGLDPEEAIDIIIEVADILESTRRRGVVHRDLKPSNIMFTGDGKIKLTDFGIAKPTDGDSTDLTQSGSVVGTPYYISPEAAAGNNVTWRSDMYSLGCTLYRLLFGRLPYSGAGAVQLALAHVREPFPEPDSRPPGVSPELMDVVRRMMAKDPEARFPDYASLALALNEARPKLIEPIGPLKRLGVGVLDGVVTVGTVTILILVAAGVLVNLGLGPAAQRLQKPIATLLFAAVAAVSAGLIPAFSGSTLLQGFFAMKVRAETARRPGRWRLFWRGVLASPLASVGLVSALAVLLTGVRLGEAAGGLGVLALSVWHLTDFVVAFFDERKRFLHDILFRTRLQYVTYEDRRRPARRADAVAPQDTPTGETA